jgi:hypothetical protein
MQGEFVDKRKSPDAKSTNRGSFVKLKAEEMGGVAQQYVIELLALEKAGAQL